jgi:glycosyltransferase involved in cell wall biosynthesis
VTVFGICMVRDEADIIGPVIERMLAQVDEIITADNLSVDGTRDILDALPVIVVDDPEPGYYQSRKMTRLAHLAAEKGATWVVPFDADEVWYSPFEPRVADLLEGLAPQWFTAEAALYDHVATSTDPEQTDPLVRLGWRRREPGPMGKVACRCRPDLVIEQGNHSASYSGGTTKFTDHLVIRHFPYRSAAQFVKKVRIGAQAYRASDLPENLGAHWRQYGDILDAHGEGAVEDIFYEWFYSERPQAEPSLIFDPCP